MRVKNLYGEEGEVLLDQLVKSERDFFSRDEQVQKNLMQLEEVGNHVKERSTDVTRLVRQINELAVVFKELSILVVEQGTVLDCIDYNIQEARVNTEKANVELVKTLKHETSFRARGCMSCLITGILITATLFTIKHVL